MNAQPVEYERVTNSRQLKVYSAELSQIGQGVAIESNAHWTEPTCLP